MALRCSPAAGRREKVGSSRCFLWPWRNRELQAGGQPSRESRREGTVTDQQLAA